MQEQRLPLADAMRMVQEQLADRGLTDQAVLAAMARVPRHRFVPTVSIAEAYADKALPTAEGQTISQPYMVGLMTTLLHVEPGMKVLEVGTGSGYQTAVLAELGAQVWTIELHESLSRFARKMLEAINLSQNVHIVHGDGTLGWPASAPYDRILVTAGAPRLPPPLKEQLADGGRIVIPIGTRYEQHLRIYRRDGDQWQTEDSVPCRFVPLIGEEGWSAADPGI